MAFITCPTWVTLMKPRSWGSNCLKKFWYSATRPWPHAQGMLECWKRGLTLHLAPVDLGKDLFNVFRHPGLGTAASAAVPPQTSATLSQILSLGVSAPRYPPRLVLPQLAARAKSPGSVTQSNRGRPGGKCAGAGPVSTRPPLPSSPCLPSLPPPPLAQCGAVLGPDLHRHPGAAALVASFRGAGSPCSPTLPSPSPLPSYPPSPPLPLRPVAFRPWSVGSVGSVGTGANCSRPRPSFLAS